MKKRPYCSVVIPFYNEERGIPELYQRIKDVFKKIKCTYEMVFVDDGSTDGTLKVLEGIYEKDKKVRVISLSRNFGQTAGLAAGFANARGEIIITMDGDLQNAPEEIPQFLEKIKEGYDIVSGWRGEREDAYLTRRLPSKIANKLMAWISGIPIRDFGSTFKAYRRFVIENIRLYGEMHRFIPAIASDLTNKVVEIPISFGKRRYGKSNYGITRTFRVMFDLITIKFLLSFATRPLHVFGMMGLITGGLGGLILFFMAAKKLVLHVDIGTEPMLLLGAILAIIGVQFVSLGVIAEMVSRTYYESQGKEIYFVHKLLEHKAPDLGE